MTSPRNAPTIFWFARKRRSANALSEMCLRLLAGSDSRAPMASVCLTSGRGALEPADVREPRAKALQLPFRELPSTQPCRSAPLSAISHRGPIEAMPISVSRFCSTAFPRYLTATPKCSSFPSFTPSRRRSTSARLIGGRTVSWTQSTAHALNDDFDVGAATAVYYGESCLRVLLRLLCVDFCRLAGPHFYGDKIAPWTLF